MSEWSKRLTDEQVLKIRDMRARGAPQHVLAMLFEVSQAQISRIVRGLQRKDVGGPIQQRKYER